MKALLLWLTIFGCLKVAHGQTTSYHPLPDSAFWRVDNYYYQPFQYPCSANYYFHYYTAGDTVINSNQYKKIYRSYVHFSPVFCTPPLNPPSPPASGYAGALREDPIVSKTFFVFPNTTTDSLLYDYNLVVGDTMKGHIANSVHTSSHLIVLSVDSVLIKGKFRKRWNFAKDNNSDSTYFIAGLGSSGGLIEPLKTYAIDFMYRRLVCVKDSADAIYTPSYSSAMGCNLILNGISGINGTNTCSIYPNPFSAQTTLQTDKSLKNAALTVYNSVGETVRRVDNLSGQEIIFHRDNLPGGLYFVRLISDNKMYTDKLVIIGK